MNTQEVTLSPEQFQDAYEALSAPCTDIANALETLADFGYELITCVYRDGNGHTWTFAGEAEVLAHVNQDTVLCQGCQKYRIFDNGVCPACSAA